MEYRKTTLSATNSSIPGSEILRQISRKIFCIFFYINNLCKRLFFNELNLLKSFILLTYTHNSLIPTIYKRARRAREKYKLIYSSANQPCFFVDRMSWLVFSAAVSKIFSGTLLKTECWIHYKCTESTSDFPFIRFNLYE